MEENTNTSETLPKEQYTFKFEENEIREIHKNQLKSTINALILNVICVIISIGFKIIFDTSNIIFGVLWGVFLMCSLIYLCRIISFRKAAKPAVAAMLTREYVYSVFDETLKIEVFEKGDKISEEHRKYTDIQLANNINAYILLTVSGRVFVVRKADLPENSLLLTVFDEPLKKAKIAQKRRKIALIIASICIAVGVVLGTLGNLNEKYTNEKAIENMKEAIEKTYDEYELLTWFNVYKDGRFTDAFILVVSEEKIDVLGYTSQNGEFITVENILV